MAKTQAFLIGQVSTTAQFQTWWQTISNALSSFGWVQSNDTGQVNPSSTAFQNNTWQYQVWVSGDSLSTTYPMYVKLEFLASSSVGYSPSVALTVGSGSNGAGTLTNPGTRLYLAPPSGVQTSNLCECDLAGGSGWFTMVLYRTNNPYAQVLSVERSHDTNGNDTNSYCTYIVGGYGIQGTAAYTPYQQTVPLALGTMVPSAEQYGLTFHISGTNAGFAAQTAVVPFFPMIGKIDNPLIGALCIKKADFLDGCQFVASSYGTNHTYIAVSNSTITPGNLSTNAIAVRFE